MGIKTIPLLLILMASLFLPSIVAAQDNDTIHIVQSGETLSHIAIQYDVTIADLLSLNNLSNPDLIYAGQSLVIPATTTTATEAWQLHQVLPGQTPQDIADMYNITLIDLMTLNQIDTPIYVQTGHTLRIPIVHEAVEVIPVKRIVVDLSDQQTTIYEDDVLIDSFVVSTGQAGTRTAVGIYHIQNKLPNAYASTWDLQMPNWMGIYWSGELQNGFHALPILSDGSQLWAGYLGTPISYGCIVLSPEDALTLYNWAEIDTEVVIQD